MEFEIKKYKKLFKTDKAASLFSDTHNMELWEVILKTYASPKKTTWKDLADTVFSQYIRLKGADKLGYCICVTCGRKYYWRDIQNGHYRTRGCNKYRFDEMNCHPQCYACNVKKHGNYRSYYKFIVGKYGTEIEEKLWKDKDTKELKQEWYETNIVRWVKYIKKKANEILKNTGRTK